MAVQAAIGTFLTRSGAGTQVVTAVDAPLLNGFGVPKVVIFFNVNGSGGGPGFESFFSSQNIGFDDGVTHLGFASQGMNSVAPTSLDSQDAGSTDYSILAVDPPAVNAIYREGYIASMGLDSYTIQFDKNTVPDRIGFIALNGSGFNAKVEHFQFSGGTGNHTFTSGTATFVPTGAMFFPLPGVGTFSGAGMTCSLGWAASSTMRGVTTTDADTASNPTRRYRYQRTTKCYAALQSGIVIDEADFVSFGTGSFTLNRTTGVGLTHIACVMFSGCDIIAGTINGATSTGHHDISGLSLTPSVVFLQSDCQPASTTVDAHARYAFGVFDGRGQGAIWSGNTNGVATTVGDAFYSDTAWLTCATEPSTKNFEIEGVTLNADGWTYNASTADGTARQLLYFALGTTIIVPPTPSDDPCTIKGPTYWAAIKTNDGTVELIAQRPLRDDGSYYGGYKAPRIVDISQVTRQASDWFTGAWSTQQVTVKAADTDHYFRGKIGSGTPRGYEEARLWLYLISEVSRLAQLTPRLCFSGIVKENPIDQSLTMGFQANDVIGAAYNLIAEEVKLPRRTITLTDFANLPDNAKGTYGNTLGVPVIMGAVSDESKPTPKGEVKLINIGPLTLNGVTYPAVGLLAGHACQSILNGYADSVLIPPGDWGSTIFAPGMTGWTTIVPSGALFNDINGNRYTLVPMLDPHATNFTNGKAYTFNVQGRETVGDATGSLITDLVLQYLNVLLNDIVGVYRSGASLTTPTYEFFPGGSSLNLIDVASFAAANASIVSQFGGVTGGFVIGADGRRESVRQVLQNFHVCLPNTLLRQSQTGQLGLVALNRVRSSFLSGRRTSDWRRDQLASPLRLIAKKREWHFNKIVYQYEPSYNGGDFASSGELSDAPSISRYGAIVPTDGLQRQYLYLRDSTSVQIVAQQQLDFAADPPCLYAWAESLCGLRNDVLDGVPVTDYVGSGSSGYVDRAMWIIQQALDPKTHRSLMIGIDVDRLLS